MAGLLLVALPAAAWAQRLGGGGSDVGVSWWRLLAALLVCLALAALAALLVRQRGGRPMASLLQFAAPAEPAITILERRPIGFRQEVIRLAYRDRVFLVLIGQHQPLLLHSEPAVSEAPRA